MDHNAPSARATRITITANSGLTPFLTSVTSKHDLPSLPWRFCTLPHHPPSRTVTRLRALSCPGTSRLGRRLGVCQPWGAHTMYRAGSPGGLGWAPERGRSCGLGGGSARRGSAPGASREAPRRRERPGLGEEAPSCSTCWTGTRWLVLNRHSRSVRCSAVTPVGADRASRAGPACRSGGAAEAEARLYLRALGSPNRACRCCVTSLCRPHLPHRAGEVEWYGRSGPGDRARLSIPLPLRTATGPASPDHSHT
jgi:hypothetical protein